MSEFKRGLSNEFIQQLGEEKKDSWWADVLNDPMLFVAVRDEYLNVYWCGQSLFRVHRVRESGLSVTTHAKFLLDPELANQVALLGRDFDVRWLVEHGFITRYQDPATLAKMKKAAGLFAGLEKTGCHEIILANQQVIDCEIALPGMDEGGAHKKARRVDLLSLEEVDGETVRLVFWEAKHFTNGDLRALGAVVPVCEQIKRYRHYLPQPKHRDEVEASYKRVANNLIAIEEMGWKRTLSPLIRKVAEGRKLKLDTEPKIGLVIFGFDRAQRDDQNWQKHLERLEKDEEVACIVAAGDAKNIQLKL